MDIYYEVHGTGKPIILLHGNQENRTIFKDLIHDLKPSYRLIAMDSRYHGKSMKSGELSLHQMALDVMSIADGLGLDEYDVIGFSDGANIGLTLAGMDERLKHLIAMSPNASPKGLKLPFRLSMYLTLFCLLPFCIYNKRARIKWKLTRFMMKEPHFNEEYLHNIKIPVLLLSGEYDLIKEEDLEFIAESLPHCFHKVIAQSTHNLLISEYDQTLTEIRGFLYAVSNTHSDN